MRRVAMVGDVADKLQRLRHALRGEGLDIDDDSHDTVATPDMRPLRALVAVLMVVTSGLAAQLPPLRALRECCPKPPLLVACRALHELDQVLALEIGADEVLDADRSAAVFAARLRAQRRRAGRDADAKHPCIRTVRNLGYLFSPNAR